ncbi:MAG TPA: hypothetical protein VIU46_07100 [Gallionellaceae bacterium]
MKGSTRLVGLLLALMAGIAQAADPLPEITLQQDAPIFHGGSLQPSFLLAQGDTGTSSNAARNVASAAPAKPAAEFKEPTFTLDKTHKFLGISTIAMALATAMSAPGEGCEANCPPPSALPPRDRTGTHAKLARATVALASATILTGILAHWDDIHPFDNGLTDPDNLHAILGVTGAVLMAKAVNKSAGSATPVAHAGQAELGAALMAVGIKMVW